MPSAHSTASVQSLGERTVVWGIINRRRLAQQRGLRVGCGSGSTADDGWRTSQEATEVGAAPRSVTSRMMVFGVGEGSEQWLSAAKGEDASGLSWLSWARGSHRSFASRSPSLCSIPLPLPITSPPSETPQHRPSVRRTTSLELPSAAYILDTVSVSVGPSRLDLAPKTSRALPHSSRTTASTPGRCGPDIQKRTPARRPFCTCGRHELADTRLWLLFLKSL
ncbi:uncharacterized protein J3D65DRAFT_265376 [Phyllosticta citribraziliensis]|uniref:Uncharacterized protein n=1 Tax=Phyllosticta citribraziliensis TaxID=989973 RepID=A0ABR1M0T9_9PEZI